MLSVKAIVFIIAGFCNVKVPNDLRDNIKADCVDYMNNCIVVYNKETTEEIVNQCKENWANKELQLRRQLKEKREYK